MSEKLVRVTMANGLQITFPRPQICDDCLRRAASPNASQGQLLVAYCEHTGVGGVYLNQAGRRFWHLEGPHATREDFMDHVADAFAHLQSAAG